MDEGPTNKMSVADEKERLSISKEHTVPVLPTVLQEQITPNQSIAISTEASASAKPITESKNETPSHIQKKETVKPKQSSTRKSSKKGLPAVKDHTWHIHYYNGPSQLATTSKPPSEAQIQSKNLSQSQSPTRNNHQIYSPISFEQNIPQRSLVSIPSNPSQQPYIQYRFSDHIHPPSAQSLNFQGYLSQPMPNFMGPMSPSHHRMLPATSSNQLLSNPNSSRPSTPISSVSQKFTAPASATTSQEALLHDNVNSSEVLGDLEKVRNMSHVQQSPDVHLSGRNHTSEYTNQSFTSRTSNTIHPVLPAQLNSQDHLMYYSRPHSYYPHVTPIHRPPPPSPHSNLPMSYPVGQSFPSNNQETSDTFTADSKTISTSTPSVSTENSNQMNQNWQPQHSRPQYTVPRLIIPQGYNVHAYPQSNLSSSQTPTEKADSLIISKEQSQLDESILRQSNKSTIHQDLSAGSPGSKAPTNQPQSPVFPYSPYYLTYKTPQGQVVYYPMYPATMKPSPTIQKKESINFAVDNVTNKKAEHADIEQDVKEPNQLTFPQSQVLNPHVYYSNFYPTGAPHQFHMSRQQINKQTKPLKPTKPPKPPKEPKLPKAPKPPKVPKLPKEKKPKKEKKAKNSNPQASEKNFFDKKRKRAHGKRRFLGPNKKKKGAKNDEDEKNEEDNKLYCYCQKPYEENMFYIQCDFCDEWYHGNCAYVKEDEAHALEKWFCRICKLKYDLQSVWRPKCSRQGCTNYVKGGTVHGLGGTGKPRSLQNDKNLNGDVKNEGLDVIAEKLVRNCLEALIDEEEMGFVLEEKENHKQKIQFHSLSILEVDAVIREDFNSEESISDEMNRKFDVFTKPKSKYCSEKCGSIAARRRLEFMINEKWILEHDVQEDDSTHISLSIDDSMNFDCSALDTSKKDSLQASLEDDIDIMNVTAPSTPNLKPKLKLETPTDQLGDVIDKEENEITFPTLDQEKNDVPKEEIGIEQGEIIPSHAIQFIGEKHAPALFEEEKIMAFKELQSKECFLIQKIEKTAIFGKYIEYYVDRLKAYNAEQRKESARLQICGYDSSIVDSREEVPSFFYRKIQSTKQSEKNDDARQEDDQCGEELKVDGDADHRSQGDEQGVEVDFNLSDSVCRNIRKCALHERWETIHLARLETQMYVLLHQLNVVKYKMKELVECIHTSRYYIKQILEKVDKRRRIQDYQTFEIEEANTIFI